MAYIKWTGDYGYKESWIRDATSGATIDASTADWHIGANETAPAINIYDSKSVVISGGEIWGHVSQTAEWTSIYNHMATGFRVSNSPNTTIRDFRIDGTWDGIRFVPDDSLNVSNGNSNGWLVEDVHMTNIRDDAIENDFAATGTLRDSLLDGVFSAFGTVNDQSAHGVLTVDDSIIIMKDYLKDGEMVHGSPFKFNTADPGNNPDLKIFNSIIAVQDPSHNGMSRLKEAWANLTESSGNYYLNLSDTPFPSGYPLPPKGFTILQGKAARDFLAQEKAKWLAEHDGDAQPPTDPTPSDPDLTAPAPSKTGDFNGDGRSDILWRNDAGTVKDWLGKADGSFTDNAANTSIKVGAQWQVAGIGDFNGDGRDDVLWRNDDGRVIDWLGKSNGDFASNPNANFNVSNSWQVAGTGDFNGDGRDDILWRNADGRVIDWLGKSNGDFASNPNANFKVSNSWQVAGTGDFNGDGRDDILWRNADGRVIDWLGKSNGDFAANPNGNYEVSNDWHIIGVGDFNGDGRDDILWRDDDGVVTNWLGRADGRFDSNADDASIDIGAGWQMAGTGDFNGDGRDDVLWRNNNGDLRGWLGEADGGFRSNSNADYDVSTSWHVQGTDLLWG